MLRTGINFLSLKALKTLYYSLVHCHLVYGNQIWSSASSGVITKLFRKQKAAIRVITNSRYNQHIEPLFKTSIFYLCLTCVIFLNYSLCQDLYKDFCQVLLTIYGLKMRPGEQRMSPWCYVTMMSFLYLLQD